MLKSVHIQCDWPQCQATLLTNIYPGVLKDRDWEFDFNGSMEHGPHLCPVHRHKTFQQLKMWSRMLQRWQEKPEILDKLMQRIENEKLEDWVSYGEVE